MAPELLKIETEGWSNPRLPVLAWRGAMKEGNGAAAFEVVFGRNSWPAQWRNGVFRYHHYHSNAHEALGFAAGGARLLLGGPEGREIAVAAGDTLLLPAGTGHFLIEADGDFLVVGAYPPDQQDFDICREAATPALAARMAALPHPPCGPFGGKLDRYWAGGDAPDME